MRRTLLFLLVTLTYSIGVAQSNELDSLIRSAKTEKVDSNLYKAFIKIADSYQDSAYDKALDYYNKALDIVEQSNQRRKVADVYQSIGALFLKKGEFPTALTNLNNALSILEFLNDKEGVGQVLNDIGLIYKTWGKYEKSIDYFLRASKIFEDSGNETFVALVSNNIGQIYYFRNEYEKAILYFSKYLEVNKKNKNQRAIAGAANNIASAYLEQEKLDDALNYYLISMRIYDSLNIRVGVAIIKDNIGSLYLRKKQYHDALSYSIEASKIFEAMGSQSKLCASLQCIGLAYSRLNQPELALTNLNKGLQIAKNLNQKETIKDIYETLTDVYTQKNDFQKALSCFKFFSEIKDSLLNLETINKIETLQAEYESRKKEKELSEISQKFHSQKVLGLIAAGVIILFLFLTTLIIYENQNKRKNIVRSTEKLFNLNKAINKIIANHINTQISNIEVLSYFSKYWLINTLDNKESFFVPCYKNPNIYICLISKGVDIENEEVVKLSLIDFFNSFSDSNTEKSIKEQYSIFVSTDETWSRFNIEKQIFNIDFWCFNPHTNSQLYNGNISAFHVNEMNQVTDLSKLLNANLEFKKGDRLFFCTSNSLNSFILSDQAYIQSALNKTIEKSVNLNLEQQKEVIENSIELIEAGNGKISQISILAIQR